jgi:hypothetical protein
LGAEGSRGAIPAPGTRQQNTEHNLARRRPHRLAANAPGPAGPIGAGVSSGSFQSRRISDMASRPEIKVTRKPESEDAVQEAPSQRIKKEVGDFRLQVDRQTKAFYLTEEAAEAAGLLIKKGHPVVQVSIYNSNEGVNKIIELPKA